MNRIAPGLVVSLCLSAALGVAAGAIAASEKKLKVISETTAKGYAFPESVAYDPKHKVLYMSQFGGEKLDPAAKDGNGRISKLSLDGKVIEDRFLPAGDAKMNKPKGIWVKGNRLWVTDIDAVWIFDLKTKKHKRLVSVGRADTPRQSTPNSPRWRRLRRHWRPHRRPGVPVRKGGRARRVAGLATQVSASRAAVS